MRGTEQLPDQRKHTQEVRLRAEEDGEPAAEEQRDRGNSGRREAMEIKWRRAAAAQRAANSDVSRG